MCPVIPSTRINAGELLAAEPALQMPEQGSRFVATKPDKTMLCTIDTESGTFPAVRSAVVFCPLDGRIGYPY